MLGDRRDNLLKADRKTILLALVIVHFLLIGMAHYVNYQAPFENKALDIGSYVLAWSVVVFLFFQARGAGDLRVVRELSRRKERARDRSFLILICLAGGVALCFVLSIASGYLWKWGFHHSFGDRFQENQIFFNKNKYKLWFILYLPLAAFLEEFVLRRCVYFLFLKHSVPAAGSLAAFIFALFHVKSDLNHFITVFFLGLALNQVYLRTGKLLYPTLVHTAYNAMTFYGFAFKVRMGDGYWGMDWLLGWFGLGVLGWALVGYARRYVRPLKPFRPDKTFLLTVWGAVAFLFFCRVAYYWLV